MKTKRWRIPQVLRVRETSNGDPCSQATVRRPSYLDKLVDDLAKGKPMDKILRA